MLKLTEQENSARYLIRTDNFTKFGKHGHEMIHCSHDRQQLNINRSKYLCCGKLIFSSQVFKYIWGKDKCIEKSCVVK